MGEYRKKGNNKAIDDYRVNPIGQRNHPRITVTTDSSDRFYRCNYAEGRQSDISETRSAILVDAIELRVNFSVDTNSRFHASSFFFFYRNATTRASSIYTAFYTPTSLLSQFTHEFSVDETM